MSDTVARSKNFEAMLGKVVFIFLCASIALIGVGRLEIPFVGLPFRSWSVSRATFSFWFIWKLLVWWRAGRARWELAPKSVSIPLFLFVAWVSVSLLPDFAHTGDYRYFMFAVGHYLMVVDLFDDDRRRSLLYALLAMTPGILLFRGIIADPAILNLSLEYRFAYPIAHANPAGFLFSMSIPMCLAVIMIRGTWLRRLAILSFMSQLAALILTFSRAAWAAAGASLMSIGAAERKLRVLVLIVAAAGLTAFAASGELRQRLWSLTDAANDPYVVFRAEVMVNAFSIGIDSPFFGAGYGRDHLRAALRAKHPEFARDGFVNHSHNLYSELTAGVGLLGVAIFIWVVAAAGITLVRQIGRRAHSDKERYVDLGLLGALISFIIAAFGDVPFYHHEPRIFFFTLLGLICLRLRPKTAAV